MWAGEAVFGAVSVPVAILHGRVRASIIRTPASPIVVSAPHWPPVSRIISWLVTALVIGWLIVYNVLRFAGGAPSEVASQSFLGGIVLGVIGFGVALFVYRQLARSGRLKARGPALVPEPDQLADDQRSALKIAGPFVAVLAAAGVGMGVFLGAQWLQDTPDERATTMLILALWNLLIGAWLSDEYVHMRRLEGEGLDAVGLGALITAVLASVGLARDMAPLGQVALIVIASVAAVLVYFAVWRLTRRSPAPWLAIVSVVIGIAAIVLPLVS